SETLSRIFSQRFKKLGGKILFEEIYLQDTDNFHSYLKKIKLLQPSVLFVPGHIIDSARIIKQARDIGIKIPILGGDGWSNSMYELAGSALNGNYYSVHWHKDSRNTKNRLFVKKYQKEMGKIERNGPALAYDTVSLYADAVHRAGSFNPSKVREALAATKSFKGVTGDITFNKNGDPIKSAVILRFDNGTSVYAKTINPQGD
ncbi:MAG: ABC transporter substrate-binding protein, partial [Desulfobacula sp.]|nr:ABC transporter substrate-binding protein [Desulfobacula sp.]